MREQKWAVAWQLAGEQGDMCYWEQSTSRPVPHMLLWGSIFHLFPRWYISFVNALFVHVAVTYEPTTGFVPGRNSARGASAKTGIHGLQA